MSTLLDILEVTDARRDVILAGGLNHRLHWRHIPPLVFLWCAFLRIYLVSTLSLDFMLNSFSLLTIVKKHSYNSKRITQFQTTNHLAKTRVL